MNGTSSISPRTNPTLTSPDSAIGTESSEQSARSKGDNDKKQQRSSTKSVVERNYERIVKETETLVGSACTSRTQLLAESTFEQWLRDRWAHEAQEQLQESRRHYLYDPVRHEYHLYYAKEVRLKSESNLAQFDDQQQQDGPASTAGAEPHQQEGHTPARERRHSSASERPQGRPSTLRRAVPPPANALAQQQRALLLAGNEFALKRSNGTRPQTGEEAQHKGCAPFERNSLPRKPLNVRRSVSADAVRRRQWSGGARRAAERRKEEDEAMGRRAVVPAAVAQQQMPAVTHQMLRELLRPISRTPTTVVRRERVLLLGEADSSELLLAPSAGRQLPGATPKRSRRRRGALWDLCFRKGRRNSATAVLERQKAAAPNRRLSRRICCWLLCPLAALLVAAAVAILVIVYYV